MTVDDMSPEQMRIMAQKFKSEHPDRGDEACALMERAADLGDAEAMFIAGMWRRNGDGITHDQSRSIKYLRLAEQHGNPHAAAMLPFIAFSDTLEVARGVDEAMESGLIAAPDDDEDSVDDDVDVADTVMDAEPIILAVASYVEWQPDELPDPRARSAMEIAPELIDLVNTEGPMTVDWLYRRYTLRTPLARAKRLVREALAAALRTAVRQGAVEINVEPEPEGHSTRVVRIAGSAPARLRERGPRSVPYVPGSELAAMFTLIESQHPEWADEQIADQSIRAFGFQRVRAGAAERVLCNVAATRERTRIVAATQQIISAAPEESVLAAKEADRGIATSVIREACDAGDPLAMLVLGELILDQDVDAHSGESGIELMVRAAEMGEAIAMSQLARRYWAGDGVTRDVEEALRWIAAAVRAGNGEIVSEMIAPAIDSGSRSFDQQVARIANAPGPLRDAIEAAATGDIEPVASAAARAHSIGLMRRLRTWRGARDCAMSEPWRFHSRMRMLVSSALDDGGYYRIPVVQAEMLRGGSGHLERADWCRLADALTRVGIGVSPDPRFDDRVPAPSESVLFFASGSRDHAASPEYHSAAIAVRLGIAMAAVDGEIAKSEIVNLVEYVNAGFEMTGHEQRRLRAYIQFNVSSAPDPFAEMELIRDQLDTEERIELARFLVTIAGADGHLHPAEMELLYEIYRQLRIPTDELGVALIEIGAVPSKELVEVADTVLDGIASHAEVDVPGEAETSDGAVRINVVQGVLPGNAVIGRHHHTTPIAWPLGAEYTFDRAIASDIRRGVRAFRHVTLLEDLEAVDQYDEAMEKMYQMAHQIGIEGGHGVV